MQNHLAVGLSELKVAAGRHDVLVAYSLGSCVGFALWDPAIKVGGMAHIVLPASGGSMMAGNSPGWGAAVVADVSVSGKYADTAIPFLVSRMQEAGCQVKRLRAFMVGGAHVLKSLAWPGGDIGASNVKAAQEAAGKLGISVLKMDVGEDYGRTMRLYVSTGRVTVSSFGREESDMQEE